MFQTTDQLTIKSGLNMIEMEVHDTETDRKLHPVTVGNLTHGDNWVVQKWMVSYQTSSSHIHPKNLKNQTW